MAKGGTIKTLMLKDHGKILNMLNKLVPSQNENREFKIESFNQFKWELKRHIIVEETVIFTNYFPEDEESYKMVPKLEKEHKQLSEMLELIEEDIKNNQDIELSELIAFLKEHKTFEEEIFYPALDRELDSGQKNEMVKRITTQI